MMDSVNSIKYDVGRITDEVRSLKKSMEKLIEINTKQLSKLTDICDQFLTSIAEEVETIKRSVDSDFN